MQIKVERVCRNVLPHYFQDGALWATRGDALLRTVDLGRSWQREGVLYSDWRRATARLRLVDRFVQHGPFVALPLSDGGILVFTARGVRRLRAGARRFEPLASPIDFRPARRGVCATGDGTVYVGEYRHNGGELRRAPRAPVSVWRWSGGAWEVAWRFAEDTVRHVHVVREDPDRPGRIYVCTGDTDEESVIWVTEDGFATLRRWLSRGQRSRACDLVFREGDLLWGIDSPLEQSGILRLEPGSEQAE